MNDDFSSLRNFKDISIFSEKEKENIISAKNSEIIQNIFANEEIISDFFINNSFSYLFTNSCNHYLNQSDEFSDKSIDDYMIASSRDTVSVSAEAGAGANTFYIYKEDLNNFDNSNDTEDRWYLEPGRSTHFMSSFIKNIRFDSKTYNFSISTPDIISNIKYKDAIFAIMISYSAKEETLFMINKIFLEAKKELSSFSNYKVKMILSFFDKEFSLKRYDKDATISLGFESREDAQILFLKIKETFLMLSSKMIYFDISKDYERSPLLRAFALTCFNMVKNYSKFLDNKSLPNDEYARLFTMFLNARELYNYAYDFNAAQDSFVSVVVELAHIYAEKNNLDLVSLELIEKIFENQLYIECRGQKYFRYAVIYSKTIRDNSKIHSYLAPKKLKKTSFNHRQTLYIAAINSGNLNKNLVARLAVERTDIFRDIASSFFLSRFLYINSKILKEFLTFKWYENNYYMFYAYLSILGKKDFASLFTMNLDKNNFKYGQYYDGCKRYLAKKIAAYEK